MTPAAWAASLDALEDELAAVEAAAAAGGAPPALRWEAPSDGGVPPSLGPRAAALLARLRACEALLAAQLTGVGQELDDLGARRAAARRYAGS